MTVWTQNHIGAVTGFSAVGLIAVLHMIFNFPLKRPMETGKGSVRLIANISDFHSYFWVITACVLFVFAFLAQFYDVGTELRSDGTVQLWKITAIGAGYAAALTSVALVDGGGAAYALFQLVFTGVAAVTMHLAISVAFKDDIGPFVLSGFIYIIAAAWLMFASKASPISRLGMAWKALGALLVAGFVTAIGLDALNLTSISNNIMMWVFLGLAIVTCLYAAAVHGMKADCTLVKTKLWAKKYAAA
jgi:hypothetical protein